MNTVSNWDGNIDLTAMSILIIINNQSKYIYIFLKNVCVEGLGK